MVRKGRLSEQAITFLSMVCIMWIGSTICGACQSLWAGTNSGIKWGDIIIVDDPPTYSDSSPIAKSALDARNLQPGLFGDDYPRAVRLANGAWLMVYTTFRKGDPGYLANPRGGTCLVIDEGSADGRRWKQISTICDPGRDMDNGEFIQLKNGEILLGARSVRWQESYRLPVFRSLDMGHTWRYLSCFDDNEGKPGELGKPDKGVYEPHFYLLDDATLAVMYSTEKHVTEEPSYSQIVAEKISRDGGQTWGKEIWVSAGGAKDRPGMPVWTRMKNGKYVVVHENCGPQDCGIHSKTSDDGLHWATGGGSPVPSQRAAPYLLSLEDGRLILTSNNHHVSMSDNFGKSWFLVDSAFEGRPDMAFFSSIYQVSPNEIMLMTGLQRPQGGRRIAIRFGTLGPGGYQPVASK